MMGAESVIGVMLGTICMLTASIVPNSVQLANAYEKALLIAKDVMNRRA